MDEFELIERYFRPLSRPDDGTELGIGDDCAIIHGRENVQLIVTTDTHVEGVHFPLRADPAQVGYRACATSLSDIVAMGGAARWASLALTLPTVDEQWLAGFAQGTKNALNLNKTSLIGGDTTQGPLTITWNIIGEVPSGCTMRREGARSGDDIYVTGTLGAAAAAVEFSILTKIACNDAEQALLTRYWEPEPQFAFGQALRALATSCVDISDGLLADLGHITRASGCGAIVELSRLPITESLIDVAGIDRARLLAAAGGDDYELCFTLPSECEMKLKQAASNYGVAVTRVGRIVSGADVRLIDEAGTRVSLGDKGYRHFR
jgi:thiamine-monophosphate kinase